MYRGNEWRREEVRSRQNKLIENEALAEVQLAAFPWESLSLSLSLPPPVPRERTGREGEDTRSSKPRGSLDERIRKSVVETRV